MFVHPESTFCWKETGHNQTPNGNKMAKVNLKSEEKKHTTSFPLDFDKLGDALEFGSAFDPDNPFTFVVTRSCSFKAMTCITQF